MTTLFISDLHLQPSRPEIAEQLFDFLKEEAPAAGALYILGDLFEAWLGDDDPQPESRRVIEALAAVSRGGTALYFMHGNRDFLVGRRFCEETGCELLKDHTVVDLYGDRVLLMHGDLLCTDDVEYQQFRQMVRNPQWQAGMLALPFAERVAKAARMREQTVAAVASKAEDIMDVNQQTVEETMRRFGVSRLVHGHTHRPGVHRFTLDGREAVRIVLGDWFEQGSILRWDASGSRLETLAR